MRCAQNRTRRGVFGKGYSSRGCTGAEHGQICTNRPAGAALESAVQLGRGDVVNRQAQMANLMKCRNLLQKTSYKNCKKAINGI
jgi:hypothetical protein